MYSSFPLSWALGVFFICMVAHSSVLGLSDDEAYYWVLAQKPALGYAFHPPAVAWWIGFCQWLLGSWFGKHCVFLVRLPAILSSTCILGLSLQGLKKMGLAPQQEKRAFFVLLSFSGFFGLSWMMVPDIPLFLSFTLLLVTTWTICFQTSEASIYSYGCLGIGAFVIILSKYSGILGVGSAACSLFFWASPKRRKKGFLFLGCGVFLALVMIGVWNAQHHWLSLLYQVRDRHQGFHLSWLRYLKFWGIQCVLVGPIALGSALSLCQAPFCKKRTVLEQYWSVWIIPSALVFCLQPLWAEFKPHWAFLAWWPVFFYLSWKLSKKNWRWIRFQVFYGLLCSLMMMIHCHYPFVSVLWTHLRGKTMDPRWDVTHDFYGWSTLKPFVHAHLKPEMLHWPWVGSRYQTASQAAFALGPEFLVTLLPRSVLEREDWSLLPDLTESTGPEWPILYRPIIYVLDNRYSAPPGFLKADCQKELHYAVKRFGMLAKQFEIWSCVPQK